MSVSGITHWEIPSSQATPFSVQQETSASVAVPGEVVVHLGEGILQIPRIGTADLVLREAARMAALRGEIRLVPRKQMDRASCPFHRTSFRVSLGIVPSWLAFQEALQSSSTIISKNVHRLRKRYTHDFSGIKVVAQVSLFGAVRSPGKLIETIVEGISYICTRFPPRFLVQGFKVQF